MPGSMSRHGSVRWKLIFVDISYFDEVASRKNFRIHALNRFLGVAQFCRLFAAAPGVVNALRLATRRVSEGRSWDSLANASGYEISGEACIPRD